MNSSKQILNAVSESINNIKWNENTSISELNRDINSSIKNTITKYDLERLSSNERKDILVAVNVIQRINGKKLASEMLCNSDQRLNDNNLYIATTKAIIQYIIEEGSSELKQNQSKQNIKLRTLKYML